MKVAILGYGVEGQAAYNYWHSLGAHITIFDDRVVAVPAGARLETGPNWNLDGYGLAVRSPGIRPERIPAGIKTASVVREFMAKCPAPIIGVTGTKGKGTTASLIAKMLETAGQTVHLGGNIGRPALEFLGKVKAEDWVVLELSSFQLIDVTQSPQVAVALMVVPEHLNWHANLGEYLDAKGKIFKFQKSTDRAVYNFNNSYSRQLAELSPGVRVPYLDKAGAYIQDDRIMFRDKPICQVEDVGLIGPHNLENICAAVAACFQIVGRTEPLAQAIKAFKGLEHRLEIVAKAGDVTYVDDSFSTTPETAIAAIQSFDQPKVLILGGSDKGSDYSELAKVIASSNVRRVITIGDMAAKITQALGAADFVAVSQGGATMTEIIDQAKAAARPGDVVLLSPACASFGLFKDYKDRGNQFKAAVQQIAN